MKTIAIDLLGHTSFVLTFLAYVLKDIFWLRLVTIFSCTTWLAYLFSRSEILWISVFWNVVFIAVNATHLVLLSRENRSIEFSDEEKDLYQTLFRNFSPAEFVRLLRAGRWVDLTGGEVVMREGQKPQDILLIWNGTMSVEAKGKIVAELKSGQFVGEMSYVTSDAASANVTANGPVRCFAWSQSALQTLLRKNPSLRMEFQSVLTNDLAKKLRR